MAGGKQKQTNNKKTYGTLHRPACHLVWEPWPLSVPFQLLVYLLLKQEHRGICFFSKCLKIILTLRTSYDATPHILTVLYKLKWTCPPIKQYSYLSWTYSEFPLVLKIYCTKLLSKNHSTLQKQPARTYFFHQLNLIIVHQPLLHFLPSLW